MTDTYEIAIERHERNPYHRVEPYKVDWLEIRSGLCVYVRFRCRQALSASTQSILWVHVVAPNMFLVRMPVVTVTPFCQACSEPAGRRLLRWGCRQRVRYPAEQFQSSSGHPSASSRAQALVARALSASSTVPCHACPLVCQSLSRSRKTSSAASSDVVAGVHVDSNGGRSRRQRYRERLLRLRKAGTLTLASDQPRREPARAGSHEALTAP